MNLARRPWVRVDRDRCIGSGLCAITAPAVFDQADDGLVVLLPGEPPEDTDQDLDQAVGEAVRRCPSGALTLRDG